VISDRQGTARRRKQHSAADQISSSDITNSEVRAARRMLQGQTNLQWDGWFLVGAMTGL
jgi:hypothetical protein